MPFGNEEREARERVVEVGEHVGPTSSFEGPSCTLLALGELAKLTPWCGRYH